MRFNRGTLALFAVSVIVIIGILLLNNNRASAPGESTPTSAESGLLFGTVNQDIINRFEVRDSVTGEATVMTKDDQGIWSIDESAVSSQTGVDQMMVVGSMGQLADLEYADRFTSADVENFDLADYGLAEPANTLVLGSADGTTYTLIVGKKNPGGTRYYAQVEIVPGPEATPEATPEEAADVETIYLVQTYTLGNLINMIATPPYEATATPTQTPYPTANPYSEVQQTATAAAAWTATAEYTPEATIEATAEVTAEAPAEATPEVTAEMPVEATPETTETP